MYELFAGDKRVGVDGGSDPLDVSSTKYGAASFIMVFVAVSPFVAVNDIVKVSLILESSGVSKAPLVIAFVTDNEGLLCGVMVTVPSL